MKEAQATLNVRARPMLCTDAVVRAILEERQTQDRRPASLWVQKGYEPGTASFFACACGEGSAWLSNECTKCGAPMVDWLVREEGPGNWQDATGPTRGERLYDLVGKMWALLDEEAAP